MQQHPWKPYRRAFRVGAVAALTVLYCVLMVKAGADRSANVLYLPVAYLVIVLSGLWWGRKAVAMAALLGAVMFFEGLRGAEGADTPGDLARIASFLIVGFGLGTVRGQVIAAFKAQRASEQKYRDIVERSLAGIFVYRGETLLYSNSRFKSLLHFEIEEVVGASFWRFIYGPDKPKVREQLAEREAGRTQDLRYECRLATREGEPVWVEIVSSVVVYEGAPAVLVIVYDIGERKENEEKQHELARLARRQEEQLVHSTRLAEMGEMAAGIAHELNQPLTGIKTYAKNASYMIEKNAGDLDQVKDNLRLISGQVDRASRIIGQMREFARRSQRQLTRIDINDKLCETVEFVMPQLKLSGVEVSYALAKDLPEVLVDRIRIEQVFLNLLTNARQAMNDVEERRLEIRTRYEPEADLPIVIEFADTGKGFSKEDAQRLFTPFFTTKEAGHGTGLGLSISLSIIEDHRGAIEAVGAEGQGATFTVRLPAGDTMAREEAARQT